VGAGDLKEIFLPSDPIPDWCFVEVQKHIPHGSTPTGEDATWCPAPPRTEHDASARSQW
jgi:hypothetical protein